MPSEDRDKTLREMCGDFFVEPDDLDFASSKQEITNGELVVPACYDAKDEPKAVVVKLRKARDVCDLKRLEQVVECGRKRQRIKHPHIVDWLGVGCFDYKGEDYFSWYTVEEFMNQGRLYSLVETQMQTLEKKIYKDSDALIWMTQVSGALYSLHNSQKSPKFFRGGLSMYSIFLTTNADGKIAAKLRIPSRLGCKSPVLAHRSTNGIVFRNHITQLDRMMAVDSSSCLNRDSFSLLYAAPEVLGGEPASQMSDVFSLAVFMYEVFRRTTMLAFVSPNASVWDIKGYSAAVSEGFRPPIPASWPEELKCIILSCWALNPKDRPRMEEVSSRLRRLCGVGFPRSLSVHSDIDVLEGARAQRFRNLAGWVECEDENNDDDNDYGGVWIGGKRSLIDPVESEVINTRISGDGTGGVLQKLPKALFRVWCCAPSGIYVTTC